MQGKRFGSLIAATAAAVLFLPFAAAADDPGGSSQGGKAGPNTISGVKLTTELPKQIKVDNKAGTTTGLTAKVSNTGTKGSGQITLSVLGLGGMKITGVDGCIKIPQGRLLKGVNSGFACVIPDLAAGKSKSYAVSATYDLKSKGQICLPVTKNTSDKVLWQQGPVPFGTSKPTPNAPDTPLLLGTDNVPAGPAQPSEAPSSGGSGSGLPKTGAGVALPAGLVGGALLLAGGAGVWWTTRARRAGRH
ncbi:hypothetical protein [Streptomyces sp. NBC_01465]|uniref:hypothetical protein n=1 Tax=Streptomyces sp. NBC_01465 TaxID=2903878 RepID=UPI002E323142|nr:hypothetical protein [Streptomyces sp. NBC_01465]